MRKRGSGFILKAVILLGIAVFGLSACGGGGSDSVTLPSSPAALTADAGDNQVVLNWPSVSGAATYNVYYGTATPVTKSSTKITGTVSAPKTVAGLANGTPYFFAVSAVNAAGESALSVERSATPTATPPPGAPTNIRASAGDNQVTVSWDAVAGATSYNIYYGTTTGVTTASTKVTGATSPNAITGLLNGTTYFFVVTAVNGNVESAVSFEASATSDGDPAAGGPLPHERHRRKRPGDARLGRRDRRDLLQRLSRHGRRGHEGFRDEVRRGHQPVRLLRGSRTGRPTSSS